MNFKYFYFKNNVKECGNFTSHTQLFIDNCLCAEVLRPNENIQNDRFVIWCSMELYRNNKKMHRALDEFWFKSLKDAEIHIIEILQEFDCKMISEDIAAYG